MIPNDPNQHKPRDRKKVILRLGKYLLQHKWMVLAAVSLTVTGNLLALLGPMLSGYAIDAIGVGPGQTNFDLVLFYCGLMLVFYVLSSGLSYLLSVLMVKISQKIVYQMRKDLVDKLLELDADLNELGPLLEEVLVRVTSARNKISHPDAFGRDRTLGKQSDAFCDVLGLI